MVEIQLKNTFIKEMAQNVKKYYPSLVYPEGIDERILQATSNLSQKNILKPILIGNEQKITSKIKAMGLTFNEFDVLDPSSYLDIEQMVSTFVERRNYKETPKAAKKLIQDENYFGTMLVYLGKANGLVSGAAHSTADTIRPALQIIKTKEGIKRTSSMFLMIKENMKLIFADCAINISPDSNDLAEIAITTAEAATIFDIDPIVAMLSFSTKGSAVSPETTKVIEATKLAKVKAPNILIDGEFQFDAAFVPSVALKKAPESTLKGNANIFIFPSLEAGNIGYKIAQRLGEFEAIGPILLGLNKPINDLSRGCNTEDVYKLSLITALQTLKSPENLAK